MTKDYNQYFTQLVDRYCVLGTPDRCIARLRELGQAGASHVILAPAVEESKVREQIALMAREVLPRMR